MGFLWRTDLKTAVFRHLNDPFLNGGPAEPQLATPRLCVTLDVGRFLPSLSCASRGQVGKSRKRYVKFYMGDSCVLYPLSTVHNDTWYGGQEKHTPPH